MPQVISSVERRKPFVLFRGGKSQPMLTAHSAFLRIHPTPEKALFQTHTDNQRFTL
ncbi:hypothetical protein [Flaviaesturariibacter terrae]